ncbi:hypothetical protein X767_29100 [Mesorhizobium sp. LSJC264A00]|nr:hypothetical protein X767_29100 [Mesorhizobium sp. LSJC264A00]
MHRVWNPDSLQFSGPQQPRQTDRIAPVRLDALARALGDQRGRNDIAALTELDDLPVEPVAGRAGFVTEMQARMLFLQLAYEALDRRRPRFDLAEIPDLPIAATLGNRNGVLRLRHVDTDVKNAILLHGPSFLRLGLGSGTPRATPVCLTAAKTKGGPPLRPRS